MALDKELLELLVCPETREKLTLASTSLVEKLNEGIAARRVRNRAGEPVKHPLDGALIRPDGKCVYPVQDDIPNLLIDEAILLDD